VDDFENWLCSRTDEEWDEIADAARRAGVGDWRWEEAWLALGRPLRDPTALSGRDPLARAAAVGALAALRAGASLTENDRRILLAPFAGVLRPEPSGSAQRLTSAWSRSSRAFLSPRCGFGSRRRRSRQ
jgi:hypothetical protein